MGKRNTHSRRFWRGALALALAFCLLPVPEAEAAGVAGVSAGASAGDPSVVVFSAGLSAVPVRAEVGQISTYCEAT